jgi:tetratricopeptide (TPR) repeat protein
MAWWSAIRRAMGGQRRERSPATPPAMPPSTSPLLGEKYDLYGVIGFGGFGVIYLVYSRETGAVHALKTYRDEFAGVREIEESFRREAEVWIAVGRHPCLLRALFVDKIDGRLYLGMEYIAPDDSGKNTLQHHLGSAGLDLRQALLWGIQVCQGMEHAFARGIVCHSDLKPSNIMITCVGQAKVSDFGLARSRGCGSGGLAAGTPAYMPPEQFDAPEHCDQRSDVYAFGVVLFQMLNGGRLPFTVGTADEAPSPPEELWRHFRELHRCAPVPAIDSPVEDIVRRCLEKNAQDRFQTFAELRDALAAVLQAQFGLAATCAQAGNPDAFDLCNQGMSLHNVGRFAEALACYDQALAQDSNLAMAWSNRGEALAALGRQDEAAHCFDRVITSHPAWGWNKQGILRLRRQELPQAEACFLNALAADQKRLDARINLGEVLARQSRLPEAIQQLDHAVALEPRSFLAWFNRGLAQYRAGLMADALASFDQAVRINPGDAEAVRMQATTLYHVGRPADAVLVLTSFLTYGLDSGPIRFELGNMMLQQGDALGAVENLSRATALEPNHALGWYVLAQSYKDLGQARQALSAYDAFLSRAGTMVAPEYVESARASVAELQQA